MGYCLHMGSGGRLLKEKEILYIDKIQLKKKFSKG